MPNKLIEAVQENNKDEVRRLLASGEYTANEKDNRGTPAIFYTIKFYPNPDMAEILLANGADWAFSTAKGYTPIQAIVDQGHYLYHHGDMSEGDTVYRNFFRLVDVFKAHGASATADDLKAIERIVGSILGHEQTDYIYDATSFDRKLVDLFANPALHQPKRVNLSGDALELYQAKETLTHELEAQDMLQQLARQPNKIESRPGLADEFVAASAERVRVADQLLAGITARILSTPATTETNTDNDRQYVSAPK